ncbi:MAG: PKD domain-containing protein [Candidatus Micrarchaeota archaeon]
MKKTFAANHSAHFFALACLLFIPQASALARTSPLVADHNAVREFSQIPDYWLSAAKNLTIQYAHRSDGNNLLEGAYYLRTSDPVKYKLLELDVAGGPGTLPGLPAQQTPPGLRLEDGNPPALQYSIPDLYWASAAGIAATRLNANSGLFNFSMWSWCNELDVASPGYPDATLQQYFSQMSAFEQEFPAMSFLYMTGYTQNSNTFNVRSNQLIRNYSIANNKVLYDFEDIGKYDPDGVYYPNADRGCTWCQSWCSSHPSNCTNLPSCSHSNGGYSNYMCVMKGKAFWWLMARLAGWDGVTSPAAAFTASPTSGSAPLSVAFTDQSTNHPTSWSWNFGDGGTSSAQNPAHSYSSAGTYTVTLTATNSTGSDDEIKPNYISVSPAAGDSTPPAAITTLAAGVSTQTSVPLSWTAVGDDGNSGTATSYDLRYSTAAITAGNFASAIQVSGEPVPAASGQAESFTVTGLSAGTTYYFAIKAGDEVPNWGALSNVPSRATQPLPDTTPPAAVSNLAAGVSTQTSVPLTWTAVGDDGNGGTATSYDLRYSTSVITASNFASATQVSGEPVPAASGQAESFTVTGLSAGTTYYFAIKAGDEVPNWGLLSNVPNRATQPIPDTTPPSVSGLAASPNPVEVGQAVNLSALVSDASGVGVVLVEVDGLYNLSTRNGGQSYWNVSAPSLPLGPHNYRFIANDSLNNINRSQPSSFIIRDTVPPNSTNPVDFEYQIGSPAAIPWILLDNYLPGRYVVLRNNSVQNASAAWLPGVNLNAWVNTSAAGAWNYTIRYNDSAGNDGVQDTVIITVSASPVDNAPLVTLVSPEDGFNSSNGSVAFRCNASDDFNLTGISLYTNIGGWAVAANSFDSELAFAVNNISSGAYVWSCAAYDNASQYRFAQNRSFNVNVSCVPTWQCAYSQGSCGNLVCTDSNSCNTTAGMPAGQINCPQNTGGSSGGSYGGSSGGFVQATPTPTPRANASRVTATPNPTPTPVRFVSVPQSNEEIESALLELPPDDLETQQAQQIISQAKELEKQGKWEQAKVMWAKAKEKVAGLLAKARANKASFNYWVAGLVALALVGGAVYYSSTLRPPKPPSESAIELPAYAKAQEKGIREPVK